MQGRLVDINAMPPAADALPALRDRVLAEERCDVTVKISDLFMHGNGELQPGPRRSWTITRHAICQLAQRLPSHPAYAGPYWTSIPAARRSVEFNATIADNVIGKVGGYEITLRMRRPEDGADHYIFAAVSEQYTPHDPDKLCTEILEALGERSHAVRCDAYYNGLTTEIRLLLTNVNRFGVLGLVTTADDGTESIGVTAEIRLPSGATYQGRVPTKGQRYRHIGGEVTAKEIQAALDNLDEIIAPWVALWEQAENAPLPVSLADAIDALTGNIANGNARLAHLRVKGMSPAELADELHKVLRLGESDGKLLEGFVPRATHAGLAELLLVAARLANETDRAEALQGAGQEILGLATSTLERWLLGSPAEKKSKWQLSDENQGLANRIAALAQGEAGKWNKAAEDAEAAGDTAGAAAARERAELRLVEGDALQLNPDGKKPFEF